MRACGGKVTCTARPGKRDALIEHLLRVVDGVSPVAGWFMSTSPTDPERVWVREVWKRQQVHGPVLTLEEAIKHVPHVELAPTKRSTSCRSAEKR